MLFNEAHGKKCKIIIIKITNTVSTNAYPQHVVKEPPAIAPALPRLVDVEVQNTERRTFLGALVDVQEEQLLAPNLQHAYYKCRSAVMTKSAL